MASAQPITTALELFEATGLGRCELVRGELIMMSPAGSRHGAIVARLTGRMVRHVEEHRLGTVFGAETGFQIRRNPDTVRAPDLGFVRAERISGSLPGGFFPGAPDLAVEVLSPNDRPGDVRAKVRDWLDAGCSAVWVIDPLARSISVHGGGSQVVLGEKDCLDGGNLLPGFLLAVGDLFTN